MTGGRIIEISRYSKERQLERTFQEDSGRSQPFKSRCLSLGHAEMISVISVTPRHCPTLRYFRFFKLEKISAAPFPILGVFEMSNAVSDFNVVRGLKMSSVTIGPNNMIVSNMGKVRAIFSMRRRVKKLRLKCCRASNFVIVCVARKISNKYPNSWSRKILS